MQIALKKYFTLKSICAALALSMLLSLFSCNSRINDSDSQNGPIVDSIGEDNYFEIATWNLEFFPKNGQKTINSVKDIVRDLDIDLIAVQEIADIGSFNTLLDSLPSWQGILSNHVYSPGEYQKTGLLFKTELISINALTIKNLFTDDSYNFPRPPLSAYVEIKDLNGLVYNFNLIVLHLKAFGDEESESRRRSACIMLESYISDQISNGADPDFIICGDWNDQLDDQNTDNVFLPFLNKVADYQFLTNGLTESSYISSSFNSLIDHILITGDSFSDYGIGDISILALDSQLSNYASDVSDHRPVMARFKGFKINLGP